MSAKHGFRFIAQGMQHCQDVVKTNNAIFMSGIYSEDGPPTDVADRINASFPFLFFVSGIAQRKTKQIAEADKSVLNYIDGFDSYDMIFSNRELLDGLRKRGFSINMGTDGTGILPQVFDRPGGYYIGIEMSCSLAVAPQRPQDCLSIFLLTSSDLRRWCQPAYYRWED
jgi:hypothetical protein